MSVSIDVVGTRVEQWVRSNSRINTLSSRWYTGAFWLLLIAATTVHLSNLGHTYIAPWDEAFHAVVAEHIALHPFQPTLYETAALSGHILGSDYWQGYTHIWIHIPPLGMWASGLSMRLLGDTTFALRLPGACFVVLGMIVTYLLGQRLFSPVAGLVGMAFVGFAPYPVLLSQGYVFGDVTDTPLLLLTPLAILALVLGYRSGRLRWIAIAGVVQGLCYLTKGGLGLAPSGVAAALYAAEWIFPVDPNWRRMGLRAPALYLIAAIAVAAPYNLYLAVTYPALYALEAHNWRIAFFHSYESWGRPFDYHATIYLFVMYGSAFALLLLCSVVTLAVVALRRRSRAEMIVVVWVAALYLPLSLAVTKAVPMTLPAISALGLCVGHFVTLGMHSPALRARVLMLSILIGTACTALLMLLGNPLQQLIPIDTSYHYPSVLMFRAPALALRLAPYALEVICCLLATAVCALAFWWWRTAAPLFREIPTYAEHRAKNLENTRAQTQPSTVLWLDSRRERLATKITLVCVVLLLGVYWLNFDYQIVGQTFDSTPAPALGAYLQAHTPANATILITSDAFEVSHIQVPNARIMVMFWAHRDIYAIKSTDAASICPLATYAAQTGSSTLILTDRSYPGASLGGTAGWTLYRPQCP